jgi:mRNA (2'-O-methyladenosine-N6-)-methyltransferase
MRGLFWRAQGCVGSDVIYTERRGQSQKPAEIYQLIEELVPGGARRI